MAAITVPGMFLTGDHASRPAASAVGGGALYSCTDHSLIYQSDTSSWTTWATVGGGGITVEDEGTPLATTATTLDFTGAGVTASGTGAEKTINIPGGSGGDYVLLEQHTASASSSLDFTTFISSTYDTYKFELVDIVAATSTADLRLHFGSGAGPTYDTGNNYQWSADGRSSGGVAYADNGGTGIVRLFQDMNTSANFGLGVASLTLYHPQSASLYKTMLGSAYWTTVTVATGPAAVQAHWGVQWYNASAMTALRFIMSSGNIASGTIRAYGVAK